MNFYLMSFRSLTGAQRGATLLNSNGIPAQIKRTPRTINQKGCGYALSFSDSRVKLITAILRSAGISYGKVFYYADGKGYSEVGTK